EPELRVRLPEELAHDAGDGISEHENAPEKPGAAEAEAADGESHHDEQEKALAEGLVELARMPGHRTRMGKDEGIGEIGRRPAPEFPVDEIGDPPEEQADGGDDRRDVEEGEGV